MPEPSGTVFMMIKKLFCLLIPMLLLLPACELFAGQANVFVYHRFGDSRYPSTNIALDVFRSQLDFLKQNRYRVLTMGEVADRLRSGEELPERCAVLTVDDAYHTFLTGAMPLLRQYGYRATLFVSTGSVGHKGYLSWEELERLQQEGIEIGNHSHSHDYLVEFRPGEDEAAWRRRVGEDIGRAQDLLGEQLGKRPILFAYPYGEYSPELQEICRQAGFTAAVAQQSGVVYQGSDPFALPRFPMGAGYATLKGFTGKVAMHPLPVSLPAPVSPLLGEPNPPILEVDIDGSRVDLDRLNLFVQGQEKGLIEADPKRPGRYRLQAEAPLKGRRSKYTLTAPGREGGWYWHSQLWVRPDRKGAQQ